MPAPVNKLIMAGEMAVVSKKMDNFRFNIVSIEFAGKIQS